MRSVHARRGATALLVLGLGAWVPDSAAARSRPGETRGFRLFARALATLAINRVFCVMSSEGPICVPERDGGLWPRGTADQYIFNSGIQIAGIIGPDGGPWKSDTAGGGFESGRGLRFKEVSPVYSYTDPDDARNWPAAAHIPLGDVTEQLFDASVRGQPVVSQGDFWTLMRDDPKTGHRLGVLVETRVLGWNYPRGNEDILYFIFTFYNISARDCAAYAAMRAGIRDLLCDEGKQFQMTNAARGDTLPAGGYTIQSLYTGIAMDADVANYALNFASVNVPFSLGYAYDNTFFTAEGWTFDPTIFRPPFFAGSGFVGIKFLSSPGPDLGLTLFNTYTLDQGGAVDAPQLYRYMAGTLDRRFGDLECNTGDPAVTHICRINYAFPEDMRLSQSSGPLTLPPGGAGSMVVAYIFAPPVRTAGCSPPCAVRPDDPRRLLDPVALAGGANTIDTLTGFTGYLGDLNGNGRVDQKEIGVVPGSLLDKALLAQAVFDSHFLLPFAPDQPPFFLIPGDNQVTVLWRPSLSETGGDRYFQVAGLPTDPNGAPNALYDPNYRQFDVEGYRIYRGRADSPSALQLLAQFDYAGTLISDFTGQISPTDQCAPELGIRGSCPETIPAGGFDSVGPGIAPTHHVDYDLSGNVVQVRPGKRVALANGQVLVIEADTAVVGGASTGPCAPSTCPALTNTGVPFVLVDRTPKNSFRYFYAVTAFDVNSIRSGLSSLESPRTTKAVTPAHSAPTYTSSGAALAPQVFGRGVRVDNRFTQPTIEATTGRFSGPFPAEDGATSAFTSDVVSKILVSGSISVTLDSIAAGSAYDGVPVRYYLSAGSGPNVTHLEVPVLQFPFDVPDTSRSAPFQAAAATDSLAGRYGGDSTFGLYAQATLAIPGNYYTGGWGRGCLNAAPGFRGGGQCGYNGSRWFDGPSPVRNESLADPTAGNGAADLAPTVDRAAPNNAGFNNAGRLTGVEVIHQPLAYLTMPNAYREIHGVLASFKRAADYNVYWNGTTPGRIDSVIDVTHNVPLPLDSVPSRGMNTGFGILNQAGAQPVTGSFDNRAELTLADFACVEPLRHFPATEARLPCGAPDDPADGPLYTLSRQASLGDIAFAATTLPDFQASASTGTGFALYLAGNTYLIQTSALPAGVVWSLRDYVGAISGGNGYGGAQGPYAFFAVMRPFSAQGASLVLPYQSGHLYRAVTAADLRRVHTVPDPYYVTNAFERTNAFKVIKFVNLPDRAIIRIYSVSGVLVTVLEHNSSTSGGDSTFSGEETWNVRNRNNQLVASGVYFYHIEANVNGGTARRVGRMTIVNFAE